MTSARLEEMFHAKMLQLYDEQRRVMRAPVRFLNMVQNHGGLEAARRLLASSSVGDGFVALCWTLRNSGGVGEGIHKSVV